MKNKGNSLSKVLVAINIVLIVLFLKIPSGLGTTQTVEINNTLLPGFLEQNNAGELKICYFDFELVEKNSLLMKEVDDLLLNEQKKAEDKLKSKEKEFKKWQESWNSLGQLLPSEQRRFQEEAAQIELEFIQLQEQLQMDLIEVHEKLSLKISEAVNKASKKYAQENDFDFVFSYESGQNMHYGSPDYDITKALIKIMNDSYKGK